MNRTIGILAILLCLSIPGWAQRLGRYSETQLLPENWETRAHFATQILAPLNRVSTNRNRRYIQREDSRTVSFTIEVRGENVFYLFKGQDELGRFSLLNRGNASIKRKRDSGRFLRMTILLRNRSDCYLRLYPVDAEKPFGSKTALEVVLFGIQIYRDVNLPLRFESVLTAPFSQIVQLTRDRVRWDLVLGRVNVPTNVEEMVQTIRRELPQLEDCEDGAYDRWGEPVFISSEEGSPGGVNCSGFAKWVVDGYYHPLRGQYIEIGKLKERLSNSRGNRWSERYEKERDPFFGLDWSRNLALELEWARRGRMSQPEAFDVRDALYHEYIEDVGFPIESLELLAFVLALREPRSFYLGSVNVEYGDDPNMRQHPHLVVLVPTFTARGTFKTLVFERGKETGLKSLISRFEGGYIHLVKIRAEGDFLPQRF